MSDVRIQPATIDRLVHVLQAKQGMYHLLDDLGIYKSSLKRSFYNNYGDRLFSGGEPEAFKARDLLERRGQLYTLEEVEHLSGYLSSAHDNCVSDNPDDYSHVEVWAAERNIRNAEYVFEALRLVRLRIEQAILAPAAVAADA